MRAYAVLTSAIFLSFLNVGWSCPHDEDIPNLPAFDLADTIAANHAARQSSITVHRKISLDNVRVFDGRFFSHPTSVIIDGAVIGTNADGAHHINGKGQYLVPGLIDSHCHPMSVDNLRQLTTFGVTTAFVQSAAQTALRPSLVNHTGLTDLQFTIFTATAPGSPQSRIPGFPAQGLISSPAQIPDFTATVNQSGINWVKLIAGDPGTPTLSQETLHALVQAAHSHGKPTVCHSTAYESANMALDAGVDQVHHAPLNKPHNDTTVSKFLEKGAISCPTLTMMQAVVDQRPTNRSWAVAAQSVKTLYEAGVPILGGTDSFSGFGVPGYVPFGEGLHLELELLVEAGVSTLDALRSVTSLPAKYYGLRDRGVIAKGMRADLLLLGRNPLRNISATRDIKRLFVAGVEHAFNTTAPLLTVQELGVLNPPSETKSLR